MGDWERRGREIGDIVRLLVGEGVTWVGVGVGEGLGVEREGEEA